MCRSNPQNLYLPAETLTLVQKLISEAKSLGQIARVITSFFYEYEILQKKQKSTQSVQFPVIIPVSEFHQIIVPRKRRIYDVLHVLEGLGVITRARFEEENITRRKGGYFFYYGRIAAYRAVLAMREGTSQLWSGDGFVRSQEREMTDRIDSVEQLPCLAVTAANLICLLLRDQGIKAISLHEISTRLLCAKTLKVCKDGDRNPVDVNRRIYDVVSVLATFNVVRISLDPSQKQTKGNRFGDKHLLRKHVMFNYAIFNDQRQIKIADFSAQQLCNYLFEEKQNTFSNELLYRRSCPYNLSNNRFNDPSKTSSPKCDAYCTKKRCNAPCGCETGCTFPGTIACSKNQKYKQLTYSPCLRKRYRRTKDTISPTEINPLPTIPSDVEEEAWWSETLYSLAVFEGFTIEGKLPQSASYDLSNKKEVWGSDEIVVEMSRRKRQTSRRLFDLYCHEVLDEPSNEKSTEGWLHWLNQVFPAQFDPHYPSI